MKKIVASLCLLCVGNSYAMSVTKIMSVVTLPITLTGVYYCHQTNMARSTVKKDMELQGMSPEHVEIEVACVKNQFLEYSNGVLQGMAPVINVLKLCNAPELSSTRCLNQMNPIEKVGFFAGLSYYPMLGAAVYWIKKVK